MKRGGLSVGESLSRMLCRQKGARQKKRQIRVLRRRRRFLVGGQEEAAHRSTSARVRRSISDWAPPSREVHLLSPGASIQQRLSSRPVLRCSSHTRSDLGCTHHPTFSNLRSSAKSSSSSSASPPSAAAASDGRCWRESVSRAPNWGPPTGLPVDVDGRCGWSIDSPPRELPSPQP